MNFNPNNHMTQIKTKEGMKDYLGVQWRLVWFRGDCPEGTIETEMLVLEPDRETEEEGFAWNDEKRKSEKIMKRASGFAVFRAKVTDGKGGMAMGTKSEKAASFADYIEKAETGAIGRALAALGYGTQFVADEFDEGERIVDAPVQRKASEKPVTSPASRPSQQNISPPSQTALASPGGENAAKSGSTLSGNLAHLIARAKERAKAVGMASNIDEWYAFVKDVIGEQVAKDADLDLARIAKINGKLAQLEQERQGAA